MPLIGSTYKSYNAVPPRTDTAAYTGVDQKFTGGSAGLRFDTEVTAVSGTGPTLTLTIQFKDENSGAYYTLLAGVAISAVGHQVLHVDPRIPAGANTVAQVIPPRTFRVTAAIGGTGSPSVSWSCRVTYGDA